MSEKKEKELTLRDLCAKSPRPDKFHEDDGGMFFFRCKHCGLVDEDDVAAVAGAMTDNYPRLGR